MRQGGEMTPYYQDDAVTIYHGENSCCASVGRVVDCAHENTIRETGSGHDEGATASGEEGGNCRSEVSTGAGHGKQAVRRMDRKTEAVGGRSSGMEGRRGGRQSGPFACLAPIPSATVFCLREGAFGAASLGRKHSQQRTMQHSVCLPEMPHGKGWAA